MSKQQIIAFGSLFSGIGGIDLGLERAGMTCKWQVEIDDYCTRVLEKHWPGVKRYRDVRDVGAHNLESIDLICGGFPCQPFSIAGKRRGANDDRNLWPEMRRIIAEIRPAWVLCENVPGFINLGLDDMLVDLEAIGYEGQPFVIPACAVGAPHRRYRLFVVAHANRERCHEFLLAKEPIREKQSRGDAIADNVADADREWQQQPGGIESQERERLGYGGKTVSNTNRESLGWPTESWPQRNQWAIEPDMGRVAHGVPRRVDRLRGLGNAVVPQVAELLGRLIMAAEAISHV